MILSFLENMHEKSLGFSHMHEKKRVEFLDFLKF
jgi:hypothetical protein